MGENESQEWRGGETARNSLLWSLLEPLPEPSVAPFFLCYTQWHLPFSHHAPTVKTDLYLTLLVKLILPSILPPIAIPTFSLLFFAFLYLFQTLLPLSKSFVLCKLFLIMHCLNCWLIVFKIWCYVLISLMD